MVDWGSSQRLRLVADQDGNVDVVDNINGHLTSHGAGNRDVHGHLHGVLHDLGHSDGHSDWHLHLHGALDLLSHHHVVGAGHGDWNGTADGGTVHVTQLRTGQIHTDGRIPGAPRT